MRDLVRARNGAGSERRPLGERRDRGVVHAAGGERLIIATSSGSMYRIMHRFWETFIRPILAIAKPRIIVEIGAEEGTNTRNILDYCRENNAFCHIIDPCEIGNIHEIASLLQQHGTHHRNLSLCVLPTLEKADVYLIDGDHNWYTVRHELEAIYATATDRPPFPIILFHDVSWPYGRRDLYYTPETIPEPYLHPHGRLGMIPGQSQACEGHGINRTLNNALIEGAPRSGVLTAIEDFLCAHEGLCDFSIMPGFHGFGMLLPRSGMPKELHGALRSMFEMSDAASRHLEKVATNWYQARATICELMAEAEDLRRLVAALQKDLDQRKAADREHEEAGFGPPPSRNPR